MSGSETVAVLINTDNNTVAADDKNTVDTESNLSALFVSESSTEDVTLVPDLSFEPKLDSPGVNGESQPLLGGFDVSYNQFQGDFTFTGEMQ